MNLYDISLKITEKEYRELPYLSQSSIATYSREGFSCVSKLGEKKESPSLLFGSLVDCMLTGSEENLNREFIAADLPKVTDSIELVIRTLASRYGSSYSSISNIPETIIHSVCDELDIYSGSWKSKRVNILKGANNLYTLLIASEGKALVGTDMWNEAIKCRDAIRNHTIGSTLFVKDEFNRDIELYHQLKFTAEYEGIVFKGMLDGILVDHNKKIIIPFDLKTTYHPAYNFYKSYLHWQYFHQSNMYTYLLKYNLEKNNIYKDYKISDFLFIAISREDYMPIVWKDQSSMQITNYSPKTKNWRILLKELDYYTNNNSRTPREIKESGINDLKDFINYGEDL